MYTYQITGQVTFEAIWVILSEESLDTYEDFEKAAWDTYPDVMDTCNPQEIIIDEVFYWDSERQKDILLDF